jgi:hypothetical protein
MSHKSFSTFSSTEEVLPTSHHDKSPYDGRAASSIGRGTKTDSPTRHSTGQLWSVSCQDLKEFELTCFEDAINDRDMKSPGWPGDLEVKGETEV